MKKDTKTQHDIRYNIAVVSEYLRKNHRIEALFCAGGGDEYRIDEGIIEINSRTNLTHQLHILLHEAGHAIIQKNAKKYLKQFPFASAVYESRHKSYRIDIIREEIYAWDKGIELAGRLKIKIDRTKYYKHLEANLWKYIVWCVHRNVPD